MKIVLLSEDCSIHKEISARDLQPLNQLSLSKQIDFFLKETDNVDFGQWLLFTHEEKTEITRTINSLCGDKEVFDLISESVFNNFGRLFLLSVKGFSNDKVWGIKLFS